MARGPKMPGRILFLQWKYPKENMLQRMQSKRRLHRCSGLGFNDTRNTATQPYIAHNHVGGRSRRTESGSIWWKTMEEEYCGA